MNLGVEAYIGPSIAAFMAVGGARVNSLCFLLDGLWTSGDKNRHFSLGLSIHVFFSFSGGFVVTHRVFES